MHTGSADRVSPTEVSSEPVSPGIHPTLRRCSEEFASLQLVDESPTEDADLGLRNVDAIFDVLDLRNVASNTVCMIHRAYTMCVCVCVCVILYMCISYIINTYI